MVTREVGVNAGTLCLVLHGGGRVVLLCNTAKKCEECDKQILSKLIKKQM